MSLPVFPDGFVYVDENLRFYTRNDDSTMVSAKIMKVFLLNGTPVVTLIGYQSSGNLIKWVAREDFLNTHTIIDIEEQL